MRQETLTWIIAALLGIGCTLGYAIRTLYHMQGKALYPLLRIRSKEGRYSSIVMTRTWRHAARLPVTASIYLR
ncbi:MAG: hypothetical protein AB7G68_04710 [Nitrospiraceae bacterium]